MRPGRPTGIETAPASGASQNKWQQRGYHTPMRPARFERRQWLLILAACLLGSLSTIGAALPYPLLPPLFVGTHHYAIQDFMGLPPKLLFGFALAINPFGLLIGSALLGSVSDRYGRRATLFATACAAAVGHGLSAWALVEGSYPLFMLARFATGLAEGNGAVARAMLADRIEGAARTQAFAWFNSALYLGWLIGPLLAGATLGFGMVAPFLVAAVALLASGAMTLLVLPREAPGAPLGALWQHARERHSLNLLAHPPIRRVFLLHLTFTLGLTAFYEFYPVWLVEVAGFGARGIAGVTALLCAALAAASSVAGRPQRAAPVRVSALGAAGAALCFALTAIGGETVGLCAIVLAGLPISFYNTLIQSEVSRRFGDAHGQGAVMGLVSTVFCISNIVAAMVGAVLAVVDTRAVLALGAVCSFAAAVGLARWERREAVAGAREQLAGTGDTAYRP